MFEDGNLMLVTDPGSWKYLCFERVGTKDMLPESTLPCKAGVVVVAPRGEPAGCWCCAGSACVAAAASAASRAAWPSGP
jgi:hypothetical protein